MYACQYQLFLFRYGRKYTLVTSEWILAVLCVALGYFSSYLPERYSWAVIAVGISCKFFVGITFSLLLLIGTEVFPTVVRLASKITEIKVKKVKFYYSYNQYLILIKIFGFLENVEPKMTKYQRYCPFSESI